MRKIENKTKLKMKMRIKRFHVRIRDSESLDMTHGRNEMGLQKKKKYCLVLLLAWLTPLGLSIALD